MSVPTLPQFFEAPHNAWVKCENVRQIGGAEVACSVSRIYGGSSVIITSNDFLFPDSSKIWALVIGAIPDAEGRLVDFPSGDRVAVPESIIEPVANGSPV